MSTVRENIEAGKYYLKGKRALSKPEKPRCPEDPNSMQAYIFAHAMAEYESKLLDWEGERKRIHDEQARLYEEDFAGDLAKENGLSPYGYVANMVFKKAWDQHSLSGIQEVCEEYQRLAAMVLSIFEYYGLE